MSVIGLVILLIVVGVVMWAVNVYIPMEPRIKNLLNVLVAVVMVVLVVVFLLGLVGIDTGIRSPNL